MLRKEEEEEEKKCFDANRPSFSRTHAQTYTKASSFDYEIVLFCLFLVFCVSRCAHDNDKRAREQSSREMVHSELEGEKKARQRFWQKGQQSSRAKRADAK